MVYAPGAATVAAPAYKAPNAILTLTAILSDRPAVVATAGKTSRVLIIAAAAEQRRQAEMIVRWLDGFVIGGSSSLPE